MNNVVILCDLFENFRKIMQQTENKALGFVFDSVFKATFSIHKLIPKNAQMTTLYTNCSLYITFTMIYYIRQE